MAIRFGVESLSGLLWNPYPLSRGITHRFGVEYTGLRWYHNGKANCWKYINDMPIRISEANLGNFIKLYSRPQRIEETGY